jgi:enamine deaminase RidA (YjgF/YER057c/UK114 family)
MSIERLNPVGLMELPGASQVTVAEGTRIVSVAGQTGTDVSGALVGASHGEQFVQAIANVDVALAAAGASGADVVAMTIYVVDYAPEVLEEIMAAVAGQPEVPALSGTLVGVSALWQPGVLVEISALAVV